MQNGYHEIIRLLFRDDGQFASCQRIILVLFRPIHTSFCTVKSIFVGKIDGGELLRAGPFSSLLCSPQMDRNGKGMDSTVANWLFYYTILEQILKTIFSIHYFN